MRSDPVTTQRDLRAEVQMFLLGNGPATASEIALGIRARRVDIVDTLAAFPRVPSPVGASPRAAHYASAPVLSQAVPSRQSGTSQTARIAQYLSDGREHSMEDVHRVVGFCRLNSRISELRSRGYGIECRREGRSYFYTLTHDPKKDAALGESESLPFVPSGVSDSPSVTLQLFEVA